MGVDLSGEVLDLDDRTWIFLRTLVDTLLTVRSDGAASSPLRCRI